MTDCITGRNARPPRRVAGGEAESGGGGEDENGGAAGHGTAAFSKASKSNMVVALPFAFSKLRWAVFQ